MSAVFERNVPEGENNLTLGSTVFTPEPRRMKLMHGTSEISLAIRNLL